MTTMLEHQKLILREVSHNKDMFRKEILKSFRWLKSYEIIQLHEWLKKNYISKHEATIREIFEYIAA